ncbi:ABC transporter permease [Streptomyces corynorhini]|uniref:Transport permease protein n=1 Tax=Streptomyces corynorhini TaxID=2282652 RepID=A0A370B1B2_9ACTN|nr:ABC transporter permease [Streptomyces corynorhini]RDG35610.1 ABC transporter permease [Streptomyces corynorhini]
MNTTTTTRTGADGRGADGKGASPGAPGATGPASTPASRLKALARAEYTLLTRNRTALFAGLLVPVAMIGSIKVSLAQVDLGKAGLSSMEVAMVGSIGMVLVMAVYANLTSAYTARREDLVLKRLRTVEATDLEILTGTALPAVALAFVQSLVMITGGVVLLDVRAPQQPLLLTAGLLAGLALLATLSAVTSAFTRTVESAQITSMPLFLVSVVGSGLFVPLEVFPDRVAAVCELLPMTGVMTLIRAGWLGGVESGDALRAGLTALVWIALALFAVRKWFRWGPRR